MSLNLEQKKAAVAEIGAQVATAQAIVIAEYRSLPVGDMTALRKKAREAGVYFRVLKNTLARRAVADTGGPEPRDGRTIALFRRCGTHRKRL